MLTFLGFLTIGVILALLLTNRVAAVVALAGVPVVTALVAGNSPAEIGAYVSEGLAGVVGVTAMFVFAIAYFGVMRDAGMFDPIIRRIVAFAGNAPVTVCLATTTLAMAAHLDGAGATTFLITIPAMMPLFDRLGMKRLTLTVCVGMGAGVMNLLPWGGPTARAATTSGVGVNELWVPLIPAQIAGMLGALAISYFLGRRETTRLAATADDRSLSTVGGPDAGSGSTGAAGPSDDDTPSAPGHHLTEEEAALRRPRLFWINIALTVLTIAGLVTTLAPPELLFLVALVVALVVNYPGLKEQTARIQAHAEGAMLMASTLLAAGAFLGILDGSGMVTAMATSTAEIVPASWAPGLPLLVGVLGVPLSLLFGPDAYYFGVLPVLQGLGAEFGVANADLARASLVGQETVGFPISPLTGSFFLLVGLAGVDIGRHIRALFGWVWLLSLIMLVVAVATGAVPLWAS
ncbi:CitMHS family transporter [Nocardioides sp. AX2bis]|uniref:CitMHS family transporter n=1 Tax=Nocardioides sp. AX2bis TaxID=2653157 RepID=UPI0012EEF1EC|nr:citrate:proton symporter [Nocardioides sp. AX2bis]VXB43448.1 Citrate transporter [Nocardioides sp. AX2bis]